jgi:hypothetical protein
MTLSGVLRALTQDPYDHFDVVSVMWAFFEIKGVIQRGILIVALRFNNDEDPRAASERLERFLSRAESVHTAPSVACFIGCIAPKSVDLDQRSKWARR